MVPPFPAASQADAVPADVAPQPPPANDPPMSDWRALGYLGGFGGSGEEGAAVGVSFQYRYGFLVAGALAETGGGMAMNYRGLAAAAGFALRPQRNLRFELLGTVGVHDYRRVGADWLLGADPGARADLGYGGARTAVSYVFGKRLNHFELGAYADYQNDFSRDRVVYADPAKGDGWFDGGGTGDHVVGFSRLGFCLELGGVHDIL